MSDDDRPDDDYTPIACGLYSEYEVAILHRELLRIHWRDEQGLDHIERVIPTDLQTRDHCEYLIAEDCVDGSTLAIRLDRIFHFEREQP